MYSPKRRGDRQEPISSRQSTNHDSNSLEEKEDNSPEIIKPNFGLSGKLAAESNKYNGVALKYQEPPEARKPTKRWRLYVFKKEEQVANPTSNGVPSISYPLIDCLHIHRQSAYLLGRDRKVADIPIDHPSCSSQHAVLQFRQITFTDSETGEQKTDIKPYIIDLESSNSTFVNKKIIPTSRYVELRAYDEIKFGFSSRDYVLLYDELADTEDISEVKSV
ncbi:hypothetical protein Glove_402g73 [Diversispora epigaea]|uniref:FHA domain-containing protein n=1 Tax=Diversispora epigaea TaxID=1348612 RepID=A0A397H7B1_9GLOM|nr:hypothetical protein Glove_402g73 [Diversispora epigaea]